jgi:hypothetical protein
MMSLLFSSLIRDCANLNQVEEFGPDFAQVAAYRFIGLLVDACFY